MSQMPHSPRPLPRPSSLHLLSGGSRAFREVPGLRAYLLKGLVVLYAVSLAVGLVGVGLLYAFVVEPLLGGAEAWSSEAGWWAQVLTWLLRLVFWIAQLALMAATVVISLLVALSLMSLWFEGLVGRIITHHRGNVPSGQPFSWVAWVASLGRTVKGALLPLCLSLLGLVLGVVPLFGPLLVVLVQSYLLGLEVRDPYLEAREALDDPPRPLRKGLGLWTISAGLLPFGLALVPVAGWLLLPAAIVYLVAGFAWRGELDASANPVASSA